MQKLADYIEESTIYNQSMQIKSNDLTSEMQKRKQDIIDLEQELDKLKKLSLGVINEDDRLHSSF